MSRHRTTLWPRSLIARMTLLSAVFFVLAVCWFAIVPYWHYVSEDPLRLTENRARVEILRAINDSEPIIASLAESPILLEVAEANDRFRYYVRHGDREASFGPPPKHLAKIPHLRTLLAGADPASRAYWSASIHENGATTWVSFRVEEGVETYYELSGVVAPIESVSDIFAAVNPMSFWWTTRDPLIAGGGVLIIAFIVLLLSARSLRSLARAADAIDITSGDRHLLPEKGLPAEVATLVRAINEMIRRVEAAHEEQEMFLATAAHELRTPMSVLRTRLEELPEADAKEILRDDVRRMSSLVDQLLRLLQIRNSHELPDRVDLVATARDVVADRAPLSINRGIDIELATEPKSLVVKGHRGLVGVALANLVDNAISFSKPGDNLKVNVYETGRVAVRDCGPGIPRSELERIFEPFAKNPPNRQGHGLGLAIVRAVMTAHGGDVSARNVEGGGTVFALQFRNPSRQPA